jgi:hypothetical protein
MITATQKALLEAVKEDQDELAILLAVSLMSFDFEVVDYIVDKYQDQFTAEEIDAVKENRQRLELELAMAEREYATIH